MSTTHPYAIFCQSRRWVTRPDGERIMVARGPARVINAWRFRTRNAARRQIMQMVNDPGWEHRNPHNPDPKFYWVKRLEE